MIYTVAIDGPVGAGKSSVANDVAKQLHILHLDTGAMYRAFAWLALREGIATDDAQALVSLTQRAMPEVRYQDGKQHTLIDGQDVSDLIRTPEISMAASDVSKVAGVRAAMVARQQALAAKQSMLLDGRDIGTRVLPNATIKIYLTASAEVRAQRRFDELQAKGDPSTYEEVLADVLKRDEQDTTRETDPLRPAEDAQVLDCSEMTQQQVVADIVRRLNLKLGKKPAPAERFTPMYKIARGVAAFMLTCITPIAYHNIERAQLDAPYILISNHNSLWDPMLVAWKCYRYQPRFLGKRELIKNPILKWLFIHMCMIPVDRHNMDMAAIRACMKALKEGHCLAIFPEGTRHKKGVMEDLESGISMIALRGGVRLLPVYLTSKPKLFRRTHVYYGQPISIADIAKKGVNKDTCEEVLTRITSTYRELVKQHQALTDGAGSNKQA